MGAEEEIQGLYVRYLGGDGPAFDAMYSRLVPMASSMVTKRFNKSGISNKDKADDIAHMAVARLYERVLSKGRPVRRFGKMLWYEVRYFFDPRYRENRECLDIPPDAASSDSKSSSLESFIGEVLEMKNGKRLLVDMVAASKYSGFVRRIGNYIEKRWIYNHAEDLQCQYRKISQMLGKPAR